MGSEGRVAGTHGMDVLYQRTNARTHQANTLTRKQAHWPFHSTANRSSRVQHRQPAPEALNTNACRSIAPPLDSKPQPPSFITITNCVNQENSQPITAPQSLYIYLIILQQPITSPQLYTCVEGATHDFYVCC